MKLLLDEHYADEIAVRLRAAGHDAVSVADSGLRGTGDAQLLEYAAQKGRALLTNNVRDFLPLVTDWIASGRDHAGLLLTSDTSMPRGKGSIGLYLDTIGRLMDAHPSERALTNEVRWLP